MLLTGAYFRSLDDKLRLSFPKRLRETLFGPETPEDAALYLAPGTDGSLALYTEEAFASLGSQLANGSPTGRHERDFSRMFYGRAERLDIDRQGRIRIPADLAQLAALQKEIVLVGVRDHLEIWDRERWDQYVQMRQDHFDEIAENAFGQGAASPQPEPRPTTPSQPR